MDHKPFSPSRSLAQPVSVTEKMCVIADSLIGLLSEFNLKGATTGTSAKSSERLAIVCARKYFKYASNQIKWIHDVKSIRSASLFERTKICHR